MAENEKSPSSNEPSGQENSPTGIVINLGSLPISSDVVHLNHLKIATPTGTIISIEKNSTAKTRNLIFVVGDVFVSIDLTDKTKEMLTRLLSHY